MLPEKSILRSDLGLAPSCNSDVTYVQWANLPLACPMPGTTLWNAHPRVYLPVHRTGRALCEYCGTVYILEDPLLDQPDPDFANIEIETDYRRARERVKAGLEAGPWSLNHRVDGETRSPPDFGKAT